MKKVCIVGSGLGGLATALRLSSRGYDVTILEKYHQAGGRLNRLEKDGFTFDMGPSFFSMSYEFDELFKDCGMPNPLKMQELDPVYAVYFADRKEPFHIYKNLAKLAEEFKALEPDFERKAKKYLAQAGGIFHSTENVVIKKNFSGIPSYLLSLMQVPLKYSPLLFRSMWTELNKHFESHEVKVIFSLVAFFLGATPFNTPAVYSLLNYTELQHDGYWNIKGGMYNIVKEIKSALEKRGVKFHFNTEIKQVETTDGKVSAMVDQNNKRWEADLFVSNADAAAFRGKLLKRPAYSEQKLDKLEWTLAPFTIYLGVKGKLDNLHHHTYFLGEGFEDYAKKIFRQSVNPEKPYYYVNVTSRSNPDAAPEGCENLFILCPVPDLRYKPDWSDTEALADTIIADMSERLGYDLKKNTISRTILNPIEWRDKFNLYKGSGLGLAHGLKQVGALRPANKDEELANLYYVGASTIPGTGLPIVVIGSKLVCERIENDYAKVSVD